MIFRKNLISSSVAMALVGASSQIYAQQPVIEEVTVTGIRASLQRAADLKRNASGVVDAISAEDMGVFPDTNLAESLQRITGVSIDRSRGEGSKVTVRGFGPQFNLVTVNGRQMPNHNGDDRSFDFADLASEGISGVEIFKTGNADVPTGGIGSTINIKTARPLDSPGLHSVVQFKSVFDTSTEKGSTVTPELSGIYSNTFADDKFGIAVTASYQDRNNGVNTASVRDWNNHLGTADNTNSWGGVPRDANQINRPDDSDVFGVPQNTGYEIAEFTRERINSMLTLQYEPTDSLTATLDYIYSEVDFERTFNNYSAWFNWDGQVSSEFTDGPAATPLFYTNAFGGANDLAMAAGRDGAISENNSIALNLEWRVNDRLTLELDHHTSDSESGASGNNGTASQLAIASFTRNTTTTYFGGDVPILELGLSGPLDPNDMIVTGSVFDNKQTEMEIKQTKIAGTFDFNDTTVIDFGVQLTDVDNVSQFSNVQRNTWGGTTQPGDIADLLTPASAASAFSDFGNGGDSRRHVDYFEFDINALAARVESLGPTATQSTAGDCGTGLCPSSDFTTDRRTNEESTSAYIQASFDRELGDIPVNIKAGLRYEKTDVSSQALVPAYSAVVQTGGNEFDAVPLLDDNGQAVQEFTSLEGDYDYLLPNIDVKFDLNDNLVGRISYSETLARPDYTDIQGGLTIDRQIRISGGTGVRGNPALLPFESENIDLSIEYYFGDADYISLGYFTKDVVNFIGQSTLQDEVLFPELIHPGTGQPTTFDVTVPVNQEEATLDGWEFAVQKTFDNGFGVIFNTTVVNGSVAYDNTSLDTQFVLLGLSDSANLIGFYERDNFQARIAYNWRDDFFNGLSGSTGGVAGPVNVESFGQWDLSASYDFNDQLTLFLEGINITDETTRSFGRNNLQTVEAAQTGARYNLGVRYAF